MSQKTQPEEQLDYRVATKFDEVGDFDTVAYLKHGKARQKVDGKAEGR